MTSTGRTGVLTVSFSGVDGAGKSTQIDRLRGQLDRSGLRVRLLRFWDDIAALTRLREDAGHTLFKGEKGIGTPDVPVNRRDKNVRGWPMTGVRLFIYLLDALSLRRIYRNAVRGGLDLVIFDRYTYDELANLNLNRRLLRAYARLLVWITPKPDISFVLDADPEAARARKPEYPIEFLKFNREAYLYLSRLFALTVIPPLEIDLAHQEILTRTLRILSPDFDAVEGVQGWARNTSEEEVPPARPALF